MADEDLCLFEATVVTGMEEVAAGEVWEKHRVMAEPHRGNIHFRLAQDVVSQARELQSIDNLYVVIKQIEDFQFSSNLEEALKQIQDIVPTVDWPRGLQIWRQFYSFHMPITGEPVPNWTFAEPLAQTKSGGTVPMSGEGDGQCAQRGDLSESPRDISQSDGGDAVNITKLELSDSGVIVNNGANVGSDGDSSIIVDGSKGISDSAAACENQLAHSDKTDGGTDCSKNINSNQSCEQTHALSNTITLANDNTDVIDQCMPKECISNIADKQSQEMQQELAKTKPSSRVVDPTKPSFRATCYRSGSGHAFQSPQAQATFGGAVQDYLGWNVDLTGFDVEVVLRVEGKKVSVMFALTTESLHRRNIVKFGRTSLRATIAYNMLRLCDIKPGDVVCDPMCGCGSIPIEAAKNWRQSIHIAGDIDQHYPFHTQMNVTAVSESYLAQNKPPLNLDIFRWDVTRLPLKESCIDVFVTDMPFGKRCGSRFTNQRLYPRVLNEMTRVTKLETGRACLLTQDRKCFAKTFAMFSRFWRRMSTLSVNIGGLTAGVYLLHRTDIPYFYK